VHRVKSASLKVAKPDLSSVRWAQLTWSLPLLGSVIGGSASGGKLTQYDILI
jgi:hypothetical protein